MSRQFDVCNGDADGLCATLQWRLHAPAESILVTGLKRDIALLDRVDATTGDSVLVCDISMARNRDALLRLLQRGVRVRYFDHHAVGEPVDDPLLTAHLDGAPDVCTSVLVDRAIGGRFSRWAIVGAFGDNLNAVAQDMASSLKLQAAQVDRLREIGTSINYNAYGESESDLLIAPAMLYRRMASYEDPLAMYAGDPILRELSAHRQADLDAGARAVELWRGPAGRVLQLENSPASRRVVGILANALANRAPEQGVALLLPRRDGGWRVSLRAPVSAPRGAGDLCAKFGGAGRAGAGGIDALPDAAVDDFVAAFGQAPWLRPQS